MSSKQDYGLPENVERLVHANGLELRRRWRSWQAFSYLVFGLLWFGFSFRNGPPLFQALPYGDVLYTLSLVIGTAIIYFGLCQIVNYSSIRVYPDRLQIKHGPLPLLLGKSIERSDIKQLYVHQHNRRTENGTVISYELRMQSQRGKDYCLLKHVTEKLSVKYIEQEIEAYLGIHNVAVKGEVSN